jgi:hypothetical protein
MPPPRSPWAVRLEIALLALVLLVLAFVIAG